MSAIEVSTSVYFNPDFTDWHRTSHAQRGVGGGYGGVHQMDGLCSCPSESQPIGACTEMDLKNNVSGQRANRNIVEV